MRYEDGPSMTARHALPFEQAAQLSALISLIQLRTELVLYSTELYCTDSTQKVYPSIVEVLDTVFF